MVNILRQSEITVLEFGERYSSLVEKKLSKDAQQIIGTVKTAEPPLVVFDLTEVQLIDNLLYSVVSTCVEAHQET